MRVTRRTFLKSSAVAVAGLATSENLLERVVGIPLHQEAQAEAEATVTEEWIPTTCWIGKQDCGILARRIDGRVVKLEGNPLHPRNKGALCPKGFGQIMALYDPNRVKTPLIRTNEKGVPGKFREASWDEALTLVAEKLNEVRAKDPKQVLWQKGRSKQEAIYDDAFVNSIGATRVGHGSYCSDAGYRAAEYTIGPHANANPDFRYTKYMLSWGWNITGAGGNKFCFITWNQQFAAARERGMKVVHIDPRLRSAGPHADEWLPIKPGTDLALALALCQAIVAQGTIDREYLTKYTNAPFLVQGDGAFLRVEGKEQVWDEATNSPKPHDAQGVKPVLEGMFAPDGKSVKTSFQLLKEHLTQYTPEWAANVCGISAEQIRQVARELGENAMIGSTTVVDGVTLPYRPVGIMAYHVSQQELGFQFYRAMYMVMMLLGAVEAVGGLRIDSTWKIDPNFEALEKVTIKDPPYDYTLGASKFFPIRTSNPGMIAKVMLNPEKYQVNKLPEMVIVHMANPLASFTDQATFMEAYKKFKFVAVIDPWLSRTADLFADVVLPAATMEKYEGPIGASDMYTDATVFRLPIMEPLGQSRGEIDIYLDLCEKAGLLYGKDGFLDRLNRVLGLKDPHIMDINTKPTVRDMFDRWAKTQGLAEGIAYFEREGVWVKGPVPASKYYGYAQKPPFNGIRHRLYGEALGRYQKEMRAKGAEKVYYQDYTSLPTWRDPTMLSSPAQYDLDLISFKMIEFKQGRTSQIPLLSELAPEARLQMNPKAAKARGLKGGDSVWVESHNAVTGETQKVKTKVALTEGIRPDTVGMPHHYGEVARHPRTKGQGPTPNALFFTGEGYVTNTADNSFHVRVRVFKA
ncbi:MAG: twin-arginine translocation signal protein [Dehalococcoidia bacterium]|nr:twin-arginine translocation signal protein [Dehalococcoidia bacterium]